MMLLYSYIIWSCITSNSRERDKISKIKFLRYHFILEQYKIKNNCILAKRSINRLWVITDGCWLFG